jgi:hypothetical protein
MILAPSYDFFYTGNSHEITLSPGTYLFECWGAQGYIANDIEIGGKGAYTKGTISLKTTQTFYVLPGQYGQESISTYVFNDGGGGQFGGGASDIRLINGTWDDFDSLKSRIMVAAGDGGPDSQINGGAGGCLVDLDSGYGKGGTQTKGGYGYYKGSFGKGGFNSDTSLNGCVGGGGGYYGGGSSTYKSSYSGGGGSSFISGYPECNAIAEESTINNIIHTNSPIHYSGFVFTQSVMIDSNSILPTLKGQLNGHARITILKGQSERSWHRDPGQIGLYLF